METEVEMMEQKKKVYTGMCTCPGIAEGRITIFEEGKKYNKEDIVVLDVFVTQNVMLLRNAGAILSSKGGLTSHASILSREFNIPCLVSVKGLEELKEGTKVKVDTAAEEVIVYDSD